MGIELSVLICGLPERLPCLVHAELVKQALGLPVEIVYVSDNQRMTVGRKRSIILSIAQGEWFTFVDDDDSVAPTYIERLLAATKEAPPDTGVICFGQTCTHADTGLVEHCTYGLGYAYESGPNEDGSKWWKGRPAHTMCWRTDKVQGIEFPEGNFQEDVGWVAEACKVVTTEYRIDDVLYYYRFDPKTSRTRGA